MDKTIIICGNPRSGTQMISNILRAHPAIAITAEFPPPALASTFDLLDKIDMRLAKFPKHNESWQNERGRLLQDIWIRTSTPHTIAKSRSCRIVGNKTPGAEFFIEQFESAFYPVSPIYVYCLREGRKVLRSLKNMPWNVNPFKTNLERYKESVKIAERFREQAADRIIFCQIDQVTQETGGLEALGNRLFRFIGEDVTPEVSAKLQDLKPAQPLRSVRTSDKVVELTGREIKRLYSDNEYKRICRAYGYPAD